MFELDMMRGGRKEGSRTKASRVVRPNLNNRVVVHPLHYVNKLEPRNHSGKACLLSVTLPLLVV